MPSPEEEYFDDESQFEEELYQDEEERSSKAAAAPAWIISLLVHAILIASLVYMLMPYEEKPKDDVIVTAPIELEKPPEEIKEIDVVKEIVEVEVVVEVDVPPVVTDEVVEDDHNESESDMESESMEGVTTAISDMPLIGSGDLGNLGGGGGGGGAFGARNGGGRKRAVMIGGGSKKTESAVDRGLYWLAHHQEPDGHWDTGKYEGAGTPEADSACTAAALLAFLGAGHTDKVGKWKKNVKVGVKWLMECQRPNGSFDTRNYSNGMCTMAIAEAAGMGVGHSDVKKSAEMAVDYLIKEQNNKGGFNYTGPHARDDLSVTGWCVMGLKSAMVSGIRENAIKNVFKNVGALMNHNENATTTGDNTSSTKGLPWYTSGNQDRKADSACGAIAMLIRQYLGWKRSEPWLEAASAGQVASLPANFENMNVYRVYYAYLTLFQQGGAKWKAWNKPVSDIIVKAQRMDGDFKGSWDNNGKGHMSKGGRVLTTAFLVLSLEVYYRYKTVMDSAH